jgi:hypothetical protein
MARRRGARTGRARGKVTTSGSHVRRCGGALAGGTVAAGRLQGLPLEHVGSSGVALDKVAEGGAHPRVGSTMRKERRQWLDGVLTLVGFRLSAAAEEGPAARGGGGENEVHMKRAEDGWGAALTERRRWRRRSSRFR